MEPKFNPYTGRFPDLIAGLLSAIGCHNKVVAGWLGAYMHTRLRRIEARIVKLLEKLRAGTYRAPKPRAPRPDATPKPEIPKRDPRAWVPGNVASIVPADARKPGGFAWMSRLLPYNGQRHWAAPYGSLLSAILLQDPEIQQFAKTCPALARALRPLCHMLGVKPPDYLKLPPRPRKPRPPKPPRPKREKIILRPYAMRPGPMFGERLRRFGKKTSR